MRLSDPSKAIEKVVLKHYNIEKPILTIRHSVHVIIHVCVELGSLSL